MGGIIQYKNCHWLVKDYFKSIMSEMKRVHTDKRQATSTQQYISSNMTIQTSKKHHACTGFIQTKKRKK